MQRWGVLQGHLTSRRTTRTATRRRNGCTAHQKPKPALIVDAGIDKKLSSKAQRLAAVAEHEFEALVGYEQK